MENRPMYTCECCGCKYDGDKSIDRCGICNEGIHSECLSGESGICDECGIRACNYCMYTSDNGKTHTCKECVEIDIDGILDVNDENYIVDCENLDEFIDKHNNSDFYRELDSLLK